MPRDDAHAPRSRLTQDALRIWQAGVDAVRPAALFAHSFQVTDKRIEIEGTRGESFATDSGPIGRIWVVGGGKAGASMAQGFCQAIGQSAWREKLAGGVLSVPAGCELVEGIDPSIQLVAGRPSGVNEPRPEGMVAAQQMLRLVAEAAPNDLVFCLLSGGGSALLPAPTPPIALPQKIAVAQHLAAHGATIDQLNTVRQHLSDIKGGGLARACRAQRLVTLVLSDILGDPLPLVASGPTLAPETTPGDALQVLDDLGLTHQASLAPVVAFLEARSSSHLATNEHQHAMPSEALCLLLANNATAVDAAGVEAERLGYRHAMTSATESEGEAESVGRHLARMALQMRESAGTSMPNCLISGGEPTVSLAPAEERGLGGRNQQLALAALQELGDCHGVAFLSGGTDGEDGPTDAAGAVVDQALLAEAVRQGLRPDEYLQRNDAYHFFEPLSGLLKTGPTHTNVCDLRVVTVEQD